MFQAFDSSDTDEEQSKQLKSGVGTKNRNTKMRVSALTKLYETFPDIPHKTIKQYAKENRFYITYLSAIMPPFPLQFDSYDVDQTANHLLNVVSELSISDEIGLDEHLDAIPKFDFVNSTLIVPSNLPQVIGEEQQRCLIMQSSLVRRALENFQFYENL